MPTGRRRITTADMSAIESKQWTLASRPVGKPDQENFQQTTGEAPAPGEGQIQVRNHWMSVDPYMRGRMIDRKSYVPPFEVGEVLQGGAMGEVVASQHPDFAQGDQVLSMAGWREAWTAAPEQAMARNIPKGPLPMQAFLGVAGMPGLTAYAGILHVAELKEDDVVFVSGAAGAVGSTVVQIAKLKGCTVVGSAGGDAKCEYVKSLGADAVIDYKAAGNYQGLLQALQSVAAGGIDVYFDNVGGDHLQAAIECAKPNGRFALCGMIAEYNATEPSPGPHNMMQLVGKQLQLRGFIVTSYSHLMPQFIQDVGGWIADGKLQYQETVVEGIDEAPAAFIGLFAGANTGKMLVKLT